MSFFSSKRITVTGGAGFLGSFVVEKLRERGCRDVFVPRSRDYDLVDMKAVKPFTKIRGPTSSFILLPVWVASVRTAPMQVNFSMTMRRWGIQLIEQGRLFGLAKFVALGTVCGYPKCAPVPFKEENLWDGYPEETNAAYGLAKKMLRLQSQAYRQQYGFNSICLLPVNLYGPRDNFDLESSHVIPALIRRCLEAKERRDPEIVCWGDGTPTREFLYVEDCAEAILLATERYNNSDPVNVGTGHEISIKGLVKLVAELTAYSGRIVWDTSKPNGQPRRYLNINRARKLFGFSAQTDLREGLRRTIAWYLSARYQIDHGYRVSHFQ